MNDWNKFGSKSRCSYTWCQINKIKIVISTNNAEILQSQWKQVWTLPTAICKNQTKSGQRPKCKRENLK